MFFLESNRDVYEKLSRKVYGHDRAKKSLICAFNRSFRYYYERHVLSQTTPLIEKYNILLKGKSGTGKTYLVKNLCEIVNRPLVIFDASQFTHHSAGGGENAQTIRKSITVAVTKFMDSYPNTYTTYDGTLARAIIFFDEFDKISGHYDTRDGSNWNETVQGQLLSLISELSEKAMIIFAGAFSGFDETVTKKNIGFGCSKLSERSNSLTKDIINYGFIPEITGRLGVTIELDELSESDYKKILNNFVIPEMQTSYDRFKIKINLNKTEEKNLINETINNDLGIRYMRKYLTEKYLDDEFNYEQNYRMHI